MVGESSHQEHDRQEQGRSKAEERVTRGCRQLHDLLLLQQVDAAVHREHDCNSSTVVKDNAAFLESSRREPSRPTLRTHHVR